MTDGKTINKKFPEEQYHRDIEKYFGSMAGKCGTSEETNEILRKGRISREGRAMRCLEAL